MLVRVSKFIQNGLHSFSPREHSLLFVLIFVLVPTESAIALCSYDLERHQPVKGDPKGQWVVQEENDVFAGNNPSDRAYTQGLRVSFAYDTECEPRLAQSIGGYIRNSKLGRGLSIDNADVFEMRTTLGIGQHIFTPNDITEPDLIVDDRPYAGYLYGSLRLDFTEHRLDPYEGKLAHSYFNGRLFGQSQHSLELQIGWIGPGAGGEWAQSTVHKIIDSQDPQGWHNQLPNEPALFIEYTYRHRFAHISDDEKVDFDIVPSAGVAIGTVQDYLSLGVMARYGKNISGFHTDGLTPVARIGDVLNEIDRVCGLKILVECYAFVAAEAHLVGHNVFLDGSLFQDSHSVNRENLVVDLSAGFRLRFPWRSLTFDYSYVRRGKEFSPVPANSPDKDGEHDYGVLVFRWTSYFD